MTRDPKMEHLCFEQHRWRYSRCFGNETQGGQGINCWDWAMAEGIRKSFKTAIKTQIRNNRAYHRISDTTEIIIPEAVKFAEQGDRDYKSIRREAVNALSKVTSDPDAVYDLACQDVIRETEQAMEAAVHNFNSLQSRAGSQ